MDSNIKIVQWEDKYAQAFIDLSKEWLNKYGILEQHDLDTIEHPYEMLNNNGMIWFAVDNGIAVGTVGMSKNKDGSYEMLKLAVTEKYQGRKIGRSLIETALNFAKENNIKHVILYSNNMLCSAIHLYESCGFKHVEIKNSEYETADVMMEIRY